MMRKIVCFLVMFWGMAMPLWAVNKGDVGAAESMLRRLIPDCADMFQFKKVNSKEDFFRIESSADSKILISGNNANSMAVGLNYYLKYYCLTTVSWYADQSVEMPEVLPQIPSPVEVKARVERRFFLNYCTFGYSMAFWDWKDWQRFID